jgi:hypothetical protein
MDHDWAVTPPDVQPTGRRNARMRQTVGDMIRSMAVVLAAVVVIMLFAWRPNPEPITVVETAPVIVLAGQQAEFGLSAPGNLPAEWRPTSARWESTQESGGARVLHIGYVTPSGAYAQFSRSTASTASYLDEQTASGVPSGEAVIGPSTWERRETTDRRSLVLTNGDVVTVVSGTAPWDELEALAGTLVPVTTAS